MGMFQRLRGKPENVSHLKRIEAIVRERFGISETDLVIVQEDRPELPGFAGLATLVRFWSGRENRYRIRIFKPVSEVAEPDLPVAWLLPGLIDDGDPDCC